jgi:hypothetical protein
LPELSSRPIRVDGRFEDWAAVSPEYRDTVGDPVRRDHRGWDPKVTYRNESGKNDIIIAKTSWDLTTAWFYARTRQPLTASGGTNWMLLFLDVDTTSATGWLGYEFVVGRAGTGSLERSTGSGFHWTEAGTLEVRVEGNELELAIPWKSLGLTGPPAKLDFKWADHCIQSGDWTDLTLNGDTAPNDRFNYRAIRRPE